MGVFLHCPTGAMVAAQQLVAELLVSIRSVTGPPTQYPMASSTVVHHGGSLGWGYVVYFK